MRNDQFADIAASYSADKRKGLTVPEPIAVADSAVYLEQNGDGRFDPVGKIESREQLDVKIKDMRREYSDFLTDLAPKVQSVETRVDINEFEFCLNGGSREIVKIPHYGGPCGDQTAVYETDFSLEPFDGKNVVLCFKGVDYIAEVFVNGAFVGSHEGFFSPFEFDVTAAVKVGNNRLKVIVKNMEKMQFGGDKIYAATGLGWDDPYVGWHHCPAGLGIYNKVFVELRNSAYIADIFPRISEDASEIWIETSGTAETEDYYFEVSVYGQNFEHTEFENYKFTPATNAECGLNDTFTEAIMLKKGTLGNAIPLKLGKGYNRFIMPLEIKEPKLWDNDTPYLYKAIVKLYVEGRLVSAKSRQFGVRYFKQDTESVPKGKFYLNGKEIRLMGANTMGFEQQDVLKEDYEQLITDILLAKAANMNFLRITQRPVQEEIYDYCDRLGLMVQTDFPAFGSIRINQYCEVLRQTEEMEKIVRSHPCCIIDSYINEPFPNANNQPHRMLKRNELTCAFRAMDDIVHLQNPDRVIKHIDGDYDPPDASMPDNHCYTMWYNGHGIDYGKLHKGYWMDVKPDWHYGCGEFGAEGLERAELMDRYYPKEWLKEPFDPANIICCQTAAFSGFFYERPDSREEWIKQSQKYQAFAVRDMTSSFRRNHDMNTFALHLFIDAFPSGWQKAVMDCERVPKPAYFEYMDCLSDVFCSLRNDRNTFFGGETVSVETYINNEKNKKVDKIKYFVTVGEKVIASGSKEYINSVSQGSIVFKLPKVERCETATCYMGAFNGEDLVHYAKQSYKVFPYEELKKPKTVPYEKYAAQKAHFDKEVENGLKLVITNVPQGVYTVCGKEITVKKCGMGAVYFGSRKTGHICTNGIEANDFGYFYDEKVDRMSPISETTLIGDDIEYIIKSSNKDVQGRWQEEALCAEWQYGKGSVIVSQLLLDGKEKNPCVVKFLNNLV